MKQRTFVVRFKEFGMPSHCERRYVGNKTESEVIEFFGLDSPDIEWYDIKEITE